MLPVLFETLTFIAPWTDRASLGLSLSNSTCAPSSKTTALTYKVSRHSFRMKL
jgi:hypothetical protein